MESLLNSGEMLEVASQMDFVDLMLKVDKLKAEGIQARLDKDVQDIKLAQNCAGMSKYKENPGASLNEVADVGNAAFFNPPTKKAGDPDYIFKVESALHESFHAK